MSNVVKCVFHAMIRAMTFKSDNHQI